MENIYKITLKSKDEGLELSDELKKSLEKTCQEIFIGKSYKYLQNLGLLLFVIGIIIFIVFGK